MIAAEGEQKASKALREASMVILWLTLDFIIIVFIVVIFIVIIVIITVIIIIIIVIIILLVNIFHDQWHVITIKMNYCVTPGDGWIVLGFATSISPGQKRNFQTNPSKPWNHSSFRRNVLLHLLWCLCHCLCFVWLFDIHWQTLNSISAEKNSTIIFPLPMEMIRCFNLDY